jgi:hypothetical protein
VRQAGISWWVGAQPSEAITLWRNPNVCAALDLVRWELELLGSGELDSAIGVEYRV